MGVGEQRISCCIHTFLFFIFILYGNRFMQRQMSQDSYIHKRLIANINLSPS